MDSDEATEIIKAILERRIKNINLVQDRDAEGWLDDNSLFNFDDKEICLTLTSPQSHEDSIKIDKSILHEIERKTNCFLCEISFRYPDNQHKYPAVDIVFENPDCLEPSKMVLTEKGMKAYIDGSV